MKDVNLDVSQGRCQLGAVLEEIQQVQQFASRYVKMAILWGTKHAMMVCLIKQTGDAIQTVLEI